MAQLQCYNQCPPDNPATTLSVMPCFQCSAPAADEEDAPVGGASIPDEENEEPNP